MIQDTIPGNHSREAENEYLAPHAAGQTGEGTLRQEEEKQEEGSWETTREYSPERTETQHRTTQPLYSPGAHSATDRSVAATHAVRSVAPVSTAGTTAGHGVSHEVRQAVQAVQQPSAPVRVQTGVPKLLAYPYVTDSVGGTAAGDSVAADTVHQIPGETKEGFVLLNPAKKYKEETVQEPGVIDELEHHFPKWTTGGMSWIYLALVLLFVAIGLKFKGSSRYMKALYGDLTDTRLRHNVFDETVKETSLLVLLNVLWICCAGILLWGLVKLTATVGAGHYLSFNIENAKGIGVCVGVAAAYTVLMIVAYLVIGNIFSDSKHTKLWVKGAGAATGLESFFFFPLALLLLVYPGWVEILLIIAAAVFVIGKIVFLFKGFRIFFSEISSWLLFLYYLCSLEIVPLILTYYAAVWLCGLVA